MGLIVLRLAILAIFVVVFVLSLRWNVARFKPGYLGLALSVIALVSVFVFGVDVPYYDSWNDVELYAMPFELSKIANVQGGHVILFPRLLQWALANLTHWNSIWFLFFQTVFCILAWRWTVWLFKGLQTSKTTLLAIMAATFLIWPSNAYYYVDNRLMHHLMGLCIFLGAVYLFCCERALCRRVLAPALCAATLFTSGWGVAAWAAFVPAVAVRARKDWLTAVCWAAWAVVALAAYKLAFTSGYASEHFLTARGLLIGLVDFPVMLGVFTYPYPFVIPLFLLLLVPGLFLLGAQAWVSFRTLKAWGLERWLTHPAIIVLAYATIGGLLSTVSRAEYYPFDSRGMRWNHLAGLFAIALVYQLVELRNRAQGRERELALGLERWLTAFFVASFAVSSIYLVHRGITHRKMGIEAVACMRSQDRYTDWPCYQKIYPDLDQEQVQRRLLDQLEFMKAHQISAFRE